MSSRVQFKRLPRAAAVWICMGSMASAWAAPSQRPLLTRSANPVKPNVVFTIDDSTSMYRRFMPDSIWPSKFRKPDGAVCGTDAAGQSLVLCNSASKPIEPLSDIALLGYNTVFVPSDPAPPPYSNQKVAVYTTREGDLLSAKQRSASYNTLYYNPDVRYRPWRKSDGSSYPDSKPGKAWHDPDRQIDAESADLTKLNERVTAYFCRSNNSSAANNSTISDSMEVTCGTIADEHFTPATYYVLTGSDPNSSGSYTRVRIADAIYKNGFDRPVSRTDCTSKTSSGRHCTQAEELTNFANWYTYYRYRTYAAIGSVSHAFAAQGDGIRVGYGKLNKPDDSAVDGFKTRTLLRGVRDFSGQEREDFFEWLLALRMMASGTPLRRATDNIGQYYSWRDADNRDAWGHTPGKKSSEQPLACRKSFHILTTDGYWNGDAAPTAGATNNVDASDGPEITGPGQASYQYKPAKPYQDELAGTLADVAMYYWNRDLRPDIENRVPVTDPTENPAFWQNMVNFTVALGMSGTLSYPDALQAIESGTQSWPSPMVREDARRIDDMWHAPANSRGRFISASNPAVFIEALTKILMDITQRDAIEAGVATSSSTLETGNRLFVPEYRTGVWSGNVRAYELDEHGKRAKTEMWDAESRLPAHDKRNIFVGTRNGSPAAKRFGVKEIAGTDILKDLKSTGGVNSPQLVDYLRGDFALEGADFRARAGRLGDIVNSQPVYVKGLVNLGYSFLPASTPGREKYREFTEKKQGRKGLVFVGANDGMLHAFQDWDDPSTKDVDESGREVFAFIPRALVSSLGALAMPSYGHRYYMDGPLAETDAYIGGGWKNILIGSAGAGERTIFAIDVTDTTGLGANKVMWELDSTLDSDLGHVLTPIGAGPMRNDGWAAVFGNGYVYDSTGKTISGSAQLLIVDVQTGAVIKKITAGTSKSNGLGGVHLIRDENQVIVGAYGGDLEGNVWKFDLSSKKVSDWKVAFDGDPLYTARDADGLAQAITAPPVAIPHPKGGSIVLVGSGKLFEESDLTTTGIQALYGLWDKQILLRGEEDKGKDKGKDKDKDKLEWSAELPITDSKTILAHTTKSANASSDGTDLFTVTTESPDWSKHRGWSVSLTMAPRQRNVLPPQFLEGLVMFKTVAPTQGGVPSCDDDTSGKAFNLVLNPVTGTMLGRPFFDTNGDGVVNGLDTVIGGYETRADGPERIVSGKKRDGNGDAGDPDPPACAAGQKPVSVVGATTTHTTCFNALGLRTWRQLVQFPQ